jgi:pyrimidine-nucleoside phosphorylase
MPDHIAHELIRKKRDGLPLEEGELRWLVSRSVDGSIPNYQVSALLMAIYFRGMSETELHILTDAMLQSGDVLDFRRIDRPKVDKHSTGGVGDKISIVLAPAAAACGLAVPMISGRGLGHTGGTLDKLEAIPGFRVNLDLEQFHQQISDIGVAMVGQTDRLAPADRLFYSLRDVTATVESIPLIASSIMSKKLAEGIEGLVLDVKAGSGAYMASAEQAVGLARAMISIGKAAGIRISAAVTRMDVPIGRTVGNALEIAEAIEYYRGKGRAIRANLPYAWAPRCCF